MTTVSKERTIGVIGCGPVGVSLLWQLSRAQHEFKKLKIYLFCKDNTYATGYAYSSTHDNFLLNAHCDEMSIDPDITNHFSNWLAVNHPGVNANELVSRSLFGSYLKSIFDDLLRKNNPDFEIIFIPEEVTDCIVKNKKDILITTTQHAIETEYVVFCHGASQHNVYPELTPHPHFINEIYTNISKIKKIAEDSRILFLGSNLNMIDACLLLKENCKKYYLTAASHSGYFPQVIAHASITRKENIIPESISNFTDLIQFINTEFSEHLKREFHIFDEIEKYEFALPYHHHIDDMKNTDGAMMYRISLGVDLAMQKVCYTLRQDEIQKFKKIDKFLTRYLSGIPIESYIKLYDFWKYCHFEMQQIENLRASHHSFEAKFKNQRKEKTYDYVINCTGIEGIYKNTPHSFLAHNVLSRNQIKINYKYGLQVDLATCRVETHEIKEDYFENVFAVGEAKIGSGHICGDYAFHVTDVQKIVVQIIT